MLVWSKGDIYLYRCGDWWFEIMFLEDHCHWRAETRTEFLDLSRIELDWALAPPTRQDCLAPGDRTRLLADPMAWVLEQRL